MRGPDGRFLEWLMAHSERRGACMVWTGRQDPKGYGRIPPGLCVLHHCDNPPCWRDEHLFLGTKGDNNRDKIAKGRHWRASTTHCLAGHLLDEANTYRSPRDQRYCRACNRESAARYKAARRAQQLKIKA